MRGLKSKLLYIALCVGVYLLPKEALELPLYDFKTQLKANEQTISSPLVIVDIDDDSLAEIGPWPWPRDKISELINKLHTQHQVSTTALNILLPEASNNDADLGLAQSVNTHRVVTGIAFTNEANHSTGHLPKAIKLPTDTTKKSFLNSIGLYPTLSVASGYSGHLNTLIDSDGKLRRMPNIIGSQGAFYPPLSLATLQQITNADQDATSWMSFVNSIYRQSEILIPYNFQSRQLTVVSAADILNNAIESTTYAGSIALIGSSSVGLGSIISTPLDRQLPSVAIHAYLIDAALSDKWIVFDDDKHALTLGIAILMLLITLYCWHRAFFRSAILLNLSSLTLVVSMNIFDFVHNGHQWHVISLSSTLIISIIVMLGAITNRNYGEAKAIRSLFTSYVPDSIVDQLVGGDIEKLQKGEFRLVTVLFADIVNFSALVDTHRASELTEKIRLVFNSLTEVVLKHNGTVDKYMGDSIMAFWGAPLEDADQAENAVKAAQEMLKRIHSLKLNISIGIGISTGYAIVGNLGSDFRHSYSVMGETVNIAARLERKTRELNQPLLISKETAVRLTTTQATLLTCAKLKGIEECVETYTV